MSRDYRILKRLRQATELSDEVLPGQTLLELLEDRRVLIEHHMGVKEYSREKITVKVKMGYLCICGSDLNLCMMSTNQIVITGCISSVSVLRRGQYGRQG